MKRLPVSDKKLRQIHRWCEGPYENLRITIRFSSPMVADPWMCLDGVLQSQILHRIKIDPLDLDNSEVYNIPIPLEIIGKNKQYPSCSIAIAGGRKHSTIWTKMWGSSVNPDAHVDQYGSEVRYHMPMRYNDSLITTVFCRGKATTIDRLLHHAYAIGKKRSQGYGRIKSVIIEPWAKNYSVIVNGVAMRPIPTEELKNVYNKDYSGLTGYRPPYWHPQNQCFCVLPGGEASF